MTEESDEELDARRRELKDWLIPSAADWLRELRARAGLTQDDAAGLLEVDRKTIWSMESYRPQFPHGSTILKYLYLLGVPGKLPAAFPVAGRLARIEAAAVQTRTLVVEGFGLQELARTLEGQQSRLDAEEAALDAEQHRLEARRSVLEDEQSNIPEGRPPAALEDGHS